MNTSHSKLNAPQLTSEKTRKTNIFIIDSVFKFLYIYNDIMRQDNKRLEKVFTRIYVRFVKLTVLKKRDSETHNFPQNEVRICPSFLSIHEIWEKISQKTAQQDVLAWSFS